MQQRGFTLIELIIVIVILGILAVTAAPKFIDIQGDARAATLDAVKASMNSTSSLIHAKTLIKGVADLDGQTMKVKYNGGSINAADIDYLFLGADTTSDWVALLDLSAVEFSFGMDTAALTNLEGAVTPMTADPVVFVYPSSYESPTATASSTVTPGTCYAYYIESAGSNVNPVIGTITTGC
jgi:MSHA pilin protein MshA